ncbi:hypothetical protein D3C87_1662160 [compost metagenome]
MIALGLGATFGIENDIYKAAFSSAKDGTLVILQVDAESPKAAIEKVQTGAGVQLSALLVGAMGQKLVPHGQGWKAHYEFAV